MSFSTGMIPITDKHFVINTLKAYTLSAICQLIHIKHAIKSSFMMIPNIPVLAVTELIQNMISDP